MMLIILDVQKVTSQKMINSTLNYKRCRLTTYQQRLDMYQRNPSEFLRCYVIIGETWMHHYTSETKQQSKIILINHLEKGKTVTGEYNAHY